MLLTSILALIAVIQWLDYWELRRARKELRTMTTVLDTLNQAVADLGAEKDAELYFLARLETEVTSLQAQIASAQTAAGVDPAGVQAAADKIEAIVAEFKASRQPAAPPDSAAPETPAPAPAPS